MIHRYVSTRFGGVDQEGLAAVQVALQELEAPGCIGTLQERQRAAAKLEVVAKDGTEMEIQASWIWNPLV